MNLPRPTPLAATLASLLVASCIAASQTHPPADAGADAAGATDPGPAGDTALADLTPITRHVDVVGDAAEGFPLHLYVSNQSFDRPVVDIAVTIDGVLVASGDFPVLDQHNWHRFELRLAPGAHTIRIESVAGEASLTVALDLDGERWAVADFWDDLDDDEPAFFTWQAQDHPIGFA